MSKSQKLPVVALPGTHPPRRLTRDPEDLTDGPGQAAIHQEQAERVARQMQRPARLPDLRLDDPGPDPVPVACPHRRVERSTASARCLDCNKVLGDLLGQICGVVRQVRL